ncbi:hypothetical protein KUTeg_019637, partial [Tegillarca granosa]
MDRTKDKDYRDSAGRTALHWASEYGYLNIINLLLDSSWDVNLQDAKGQTPLHIACDHHNEVVSNCLISAGCDITIRDVTGNTPLHRAVHANLEGIVSRLCDLGADVHAINNNCWTVLHEAIRVGNRYVVRKIITMGADVNAITEYRATPFSTALFYYRIAQRNSYISLESIGKIYLAALLLYHGCKIETPKSYGRSLLVDAFTRCDTNVVKLLVHCGYHLTFEEVEQCARRIPTFSRSFRRLAFSGIDTGTNGVKMMVWLQERATNATSLSDICRVSIRRSLNAGSGDTSILKNIHKLTLPRCMKEYLAIDEVEN